MHRRVAFVELQGFYLSVMGIPADYPGAVAAGRFVLEANLPAKERGVEDGMPLTSAYSFCPEIVVKEYVRDRERAFSSLWLDECALVSSLVEPTAPHTAFVDLSHAPAPEAELAELLERVAAAFVSGPVEGGGDWGEARETRRGASPHGSHAVTPIACVAENKLLAMLAVKEASGVSGFGFRVSGIGSGPESRNSKPGPTASSPDSRVPNPESQISDSRYPSPKPDTRHPKPETRYPTPDFLRRLPVARLPLDPKLLQRVMRLGIFSIEELLPVAEDELVRRFGPDGRRLYQFARGKDVEPVRALYPPPRMTLRSAQFEVDSEEAALRLLDKLSEAASRRLAEGGGWAKRVALEVEMEERTCERAIELPTAIQEERRVRSVCRRLFSKTPVGSAIQRFTLHVEMDPSPELSQPDLFTDPMTLRRRSGLESALSWARRRYGDKSVRRSPPAPRRERMREFYEPA